MPVELERSLPEVGGDGRRRRTTVLYGSRPKYLYSPCLFSPQWCQSIDLSPTKGAGARRPWASRSRRASSHPPPSSTGRMIRLSCSKTPNWSASERELQARTNRGEKSSPPPSPPSVAAAPHSASHSPSRRFPRSLVAPPTAPALRHRHHPHCRRCVSHSSFATTTTSSANRNKTLGSLRAHGAGTTDQQTRFRGSRRRTRKSGRRSWAAETAAGGGQRSSSSSSSPP